MAEFSKNKNDTDLFFSKQDFDIFNVYTSDLCHTFIYIDIKDSQNFYESLFDYFFSNTKLLQYIENKKGLKFNPTDINFVSLYKFLLNFLDTQNEQITLLDIEKEIEAILSDEYSVTKKPDGNLHVRLDKSGKIGEYIFCCILKDYFKYDCIIPKLSLLTNPNMSVFGIDTLFYSQKDNLILFGESKLSKSLQNGISLVKASLEKYPELISNEFRLVLSNRFYKNNLNCFDDIFGDITEIAITFEEFVSKANIQKIGVPIFISHGTETDVSKIFNSLRSIPNKPLFNLETVYYFISLPILNKDKLLAMFTGKIRKQKEDYENAHKGN